MIKMNKPKEALIQCRLASEVIFNNISYKLYLG